MRGDQAPAQKHRAFYDEYLAVMDLTAEFFLQTIDTVFVHHRLAKGEMTHRRGLVRPLAIRHVALMTIEGQNDDICGVGQTEAAHGLCGNLSASMREHYVQPEVGHYGLFSGSRFRRDIAPRINEFISKAKAPIPWSIGGVPAENDGARNSRPPAATKPTHPQQFGYLPWQSIL